MVAHKKSKRKDNLNERNIPDDVKDYNKKPRKSKKETEKETKIYI